MEVAHEDPKLEALLNDPRALQRKFGKQAVQRLANRLTSIHGAQTLADLMNLPGRTHMLTGDRHGDFAMDLPNGRRLILRPTAPVPILPDGGIDVARVTRVTIVEIPDHYA